MFNSSQGHFWLPSAKLAASFLLVQHNYWEHRNVWVSGKWKKKGWYWGAQISQWFRSSFWHMWISKNISHIFHQIRAHNVSLEVKWLNYILQENKIWLPQMIRIATFSPKRRGDEVIRTAITTCLTLHSWAFLP